LAFLGAILYSLISQPLRLLLRDSAVLSFLPFVHSDLLPFFSWETQRYLPVGSPLLFGAMFSFLLLFFFWEKIKKKFSFPPLQATEKE
jgi:hypothetical protein